MGKIRKKLAEIVLGTILVGAGTVGCLNMMAAEPYIMLAPPKEYIPNFTLKQYVGNQESLAGKTIAFLTYPGAKYGRYSHNKRLK
jgi:hypothetical protein